MEGFKNNIKGVYRTTLAMSIIVGLLGFFFIFSPDFILSAVSIIIGSVIIIPGIIAIVDYFKYKSNFKLILGVVSCIIGCIFIFSSKFVASILPFIIGIYFVIMGITKIQYGFELKKNKIKKFMQSVLAGIIAFGCGILIMVNPFGAAETMTMILGFLMVGYCIFDIYNTLVINKEINNAITIYTNANKDNDKDKKDDKVRDAEYVEK